MESKSSERTRCFSCQQISPSFTFIFLEIGKMKIFARTVWRHKRVTENYVIAQLFFRVMATRPTPISILLLLIGLSVSVLGYRPVVLMHGIAADASSMDPVVTWIQSAHPGTYVKNIEIGDGYFSSILMPMHDQVIESRRNTWKYFFDLKVYSQELGRFTILLLIHP